MPFGHLSAGTAGTVGYIRKRNDDVVGMCAGPPTLWDQGSYLGLDGAETGGGKCGRKEKGNPTVATATSSCLAPSELWFTYRHTKTFHVVPPVKELILDRYNEKSLQWVEQKVSTDAVTERGRSRQGRGTRSCIARAPCKRRRRAMGPASIEEEKPSTEIACSRVEGHRLNRLCVRTDPDDHAEEARDWWNFDAPVRNYRWTARDTGLGDQDQEVRTDIATERNHGCRGRSHRGKATWSCVARAPCRKRRATTNPASKEKEVPSSIYYQLGP
ncbi:hypothetical protein BHE74_00029286 [Ensete ventricosum]|nr:hypothetical protein GW17_00025926 [Ensete ventricosum]RWW63527.1 hypothetical protein BHE74_00029286 [Ensete ventricosum]